MSQANAQGDARGDAANARGDAADARIVLLAGPEVTDPDRWRAALPALLPGREAVLADTPADAADAVAEAAGRPCVVVPLTTGRFPSTISDAARAVKWVRDESGARACISAPPGDATRTVSALRANIGRGVPAGSWALVASAPLDSFADAELFRLARLAATHKATPVEVAFDDGGGVSPTIAEGLDRCRRLGAGDVTVLRADLTLAPADGQIPLWSVPVLATLLALLADAALDALAAGDDGIDAALDADHGHGYAHSHGDEEGGHHHGHGHSHSHHHHHGHGHSHHHHHHGHGHSHHHHHHGHGHGHGHDHGKGHHHG